MNALVLERLALRRDEDVLEVGFGGGALLGALRDATDGAVHGVDISQAAVDRARRRFGDGVALHVASVDALPLPDGAVDAACSVNSLYLWPDAEVAMAEFSRVTRPGGRLAVSFEPPEELRKWPGHRFGFRLYAEDEVRALMEKAGFDDIDRAEGRGRKPDFFVCLTGVRGAAQAAP
ncbi:MAG TPA: class I SAM-dependent methyltransferase [Allosphingosinicella sp.]